MWNLEKWYRESYLQSKNRDIEIENKCLYLKDVEDSAPSPWCVIPSWYLS